MKHHQQDCRRAYDQAIEGLNDTPDSLILQHKAVLALARAGSLDLAQAEYLRYGLADNTDNEDVMALGGRLLKDAYLASAPADRNELAAKSAEAYRRVYQATGGYYSGINAATMTLLAGRGEVEVASLADAVLKQLPASADLSDEESYYVDATRSEAFLLLGDKQRSVDALNLAWKHDPLNYTAHASTLGQLRQICLARGIDHVWLQAYAPPKSIHFSGHRFSIGPSTNAGVSLSEAEQDALRASISDTIQKNDIGFGFGSLAAGSEILIAEALIEEGAELHAVLPVDAAQFCDADVAPFGDQWVDRFKACLSTANSISIVSESAGWPHRELGRHAGKVAMGNALQQAHYLSARPSQLLIINDGMEDSFTHMHAGNWEVTGHPAVKLPLPVPINVANGAHVQSNDAELKILLAASEIQAIQAFASVTEAAQAAAEMRAKSDDAITICLYAGFESGLQDGRVIAMISGAFAGDVIVSDQFACLLAVEAETKFKTSYIGRIDPSNPDSPLIYSLRTDHERP